MRISNYYSSYLFNKKNARTPKNYFLRSDYFEKTLTSRCGCCDFDESVRVMDGVGAGDGRGRCGCWTESVRVMDGVVRVMGNT
jgi:hypothetical protein